jgi:hypothetical protein
MEKNMNKLNDKTLPEIFRIWGLLDKQNKYLRLALKDENRFCQDFVEVFVEDLIRFAVEVQESVRTLAVLATDNENLSVYGKQLFEDIDPSDEC